MLDERKYNCRSNNIKLKENLDQVFDDFGQINLKIDEIKKYEDIMKQQTVVPVDILDLEFDI